MTTPDPQPPQPPGGPSPPDPGPGPETPPEPQQPDTGPPEGGQGQPDDIARLRAALDHERREHKTTKGRLDRAQQAAMTDQEKAVAAAREEGRAEAAKAAGAKIAQARFLAAAAGKLADPAALADVIDLTRFVGDDGEVDQEALAAMVDRLASASPAPAANGGRVPAGPRQPVADGDFLGQQLRGAR